MTDAVVTPEVTTESRVRDAITNAFQPIADHVGKERDAKEALESRHLREKSELQHNQESDRNDFIETLVSGAVLS